MNTTTLSIIGLIMMAATITYAKKAFPISPISEVGGVDVRAGNQSLEFRSGYVQQDKSSRGNNRNFSRYRLQYERSLNASHALRLIGEYNKRDTEDFHFRDIRLEHRWHVLKEKEYGWDGGVRFTYQSIPNRADQLQLRLVAEVPFWEQWRWRHNSIFRREIGQESESGVSLELRHQIAADILPYIAGDYNNAGLRDIWFGVDALHFLGGLHRLDEISTHEGDYAAQYGPYAQFTFTNGAYITAGYRHGTTPVGGDHLFRLIVGRNF